MNASPKINLSAIMKNKNIEAEKKVEENKELSEKIETEKVEEVQDHKAKISLSSIKMNKSPETIIEENEDNIEKQHLEKKEELTETLSESQEKEIETKELTEKVETEKVEEVQKQETEKSVEEIEKEIDLEVKKETEEKLHLNTEKEEKEDENKELFWNYQSDFDKKQSNIFEQIEEKKKKIQEKLKQPKTRVTFVLSLLLITISIIWSLFYFDPEHHSLERYQTSIINNSKNFKKEFIDKEWINNSIQVWEFNFEIETQDKYFSKEKLYSFEWTIYETEDSLMNRLNELARIKREEIARIEAEKARIEAERLRLEKEAAEKEKIKDALKDKFLNLLK